MSMLVLRDLRVKFGAFTALDGISLEVQPGEIFGFLGPNGAGKTTTIRVLTKQLKPSGGQIQIAGLDLQTEFKAIKPLFGYVPDFDNHFDEFTGSENLELYCRLYGVPSTRAAELLKKVGLYAERDLSVRHYSKGMKKKLTIVRELLHSPRLLFLDEPTANLDVHSAHEIRQLLGEMRDRGASVFVTTHNMEEADEMCDRIAIIDRGRIVEVNSPLLFKTAHSENLVDIVFSENGTQRRMMLRMAEQEDRERLKEIIVSGSLIAIHSKEFNFRQVFLKLTGKEFD